MKILLSVFTILLSSYLFGQTNEELALELDNYIQEQIETNPIPGIATCIVKDGEIVYKSAFGTANFETGTPVTLNTKFTLASISKLFVATACAQLWEEGIIDIDTDINTYLPISVINPNFPEIPITIRQLLHHKSSLHDYESDLQLWDAIGDPIYNLETFCTEYFIEGGSLYNASNWGSTSPTASSYWYSNAGFTLLGFIVESVSEMPFNQYCKTHIQTPLQMDTAAWFYAELDTSEVAMPYSYSLEPYGYFSVPEYPAAMLKSNILELANFLIAYTQHGVFEDIQLFNETTFASIVPEDMTNGFAWWGTDTWYGDSIGNYWSHGGYMNGVRTQLNYYPDDATGLIILTNGEASYSAIQNQLETYIPLFEIEGIRTQSIQNKVAQIYPNPTNPNKSLHLAFQKNVKYPIHITLYNAIGNYINTYKITQQNATITLSNISAGIYYLSIEIGDSLYYQKIVVE